MVTHKLYKPSTAHVISITIADDHPAVLLGLQSMLSANDRLRVVATFTNGEELLTSSQAVEPGVLLLDLRMPKMGGLQCIPILKDRCPDTRILVLSSYQMDEEVWQALEAGASGFISKSASPEELYWAIEQVFAGKRYLSASLAELIRERDRRDQLSVREIEVVRGIATGDSNKQIAKTLHISEYTVRNHVNNVLAKLHARDRTEAAVTAIKKGLVSISDT